MLARSNIHLRLEAHLATFVDALTVKVVGSGLHRVSELLRKVVAPVPFLRCQPFGLYLAARARIEPLGMTPYAVSKVRKPGR